MPTNKTIHAKKKTTYKKSGIYFDDCAICRAMAKADREGRTMGLEETKKVFREAGGVTFEG